MEQECLRRRETKKETETDPQDQSRTKYLSLVSVPRAEDIADAMRRRERKNFIRRYKSDQVSPKAKAAQVTATAELNAVSRMRNPPELSFHTTIRRTPSNNTSPPCSPASSMLKRLFSLGGGCKKDSVGHVAIRNEIERRKHGGSTSTAPWDPDRVRVSQVSTHCFPPLIIVRHAWK